MSDELVSKRVEEGEVASEEPWHLQGYDTFDREFYPLAGWYPSKGAAIRAAYDRLKHLEETQPTGSSGGQYGGIQDQVYVVGPGSSGARERWTIESIELHWRLPPLNPLT